MINTKRNRKDLYVYLNKINLIKLLAPLVGPGGAYHARIEDGRFVPNFSAMSVGIPWVFAKSDLELRCDIFHKVFFDICHFIPSRCRICYKVVVRPRTLRELFDLHELQREMMVPSKCGIEKRLTTSSLYGGYFYCKGKEEGLEQYQEVRKAVNEQLSPETPVILKRYCTEFEIGPGAKGPSDALPDMTEDEKWKETYILDRFPSAGFSTPQPDHIVANVMIDWIHYAYRFHAATGDETYLEFTDSSPLFQDYVTYHDIDTVE